MNLVTFHILDHLRRKGPTRMARLSSAIKGHDLILPLEHAKVDGYVGQVGIDIPATGLSGIGWFTEPHYFLTRKGLAALQPAAPESSCQRIDGSG